MRLSLVGGFLAALLVPALALGQTTRPAPPKIERNDAAGVVGRSADNHTAEAEFYDPWFESWTFGGTVGHYWTDNRKTELGFSTTGEPHESELSFVGNGYIDRAVRRKTLSVVQTYQFFRNATFHPFVGGGVAINWDRWQKNTVVWDNNGPSRTSSESFSRVSARPMAIGGFKAYFNERVFVRGDLSAAVGRRLDSVEFRFGAGFDF